MSLRQVLIANRGEIAVRIIKACRDLGLKTVLAASDADRISLPARMADRTVCIGPPAPKDSYLSVRAMVGAALATGSDALHPGYGFLAESPDLAETCGAHGITFVGPRAEHIRQMGNKLHARALAQKCGVPVLPGSEKIRSEVEATEVAARLGFPLILKAAAGGGGRGMKVVTTASNLTDVFRAAAVEAEAAFGDGTLYVERYIDNARHIEVQVLGDRFGNVVHLGERDCSLQRRHQKLVEEAPAPAIADSLRRGLCDAAVKLARTVNYESAGTVEFILDQDAQAFYFLEMNTRIQVEHPVTEMITDIDLVQEQLRVAGGEKLGITQSDISNRGHAIECRITAEVPEQGFRPNAGRIREWNMPTGPGIRWDTHCYSGYEVPLYYDSLLAKLIVHAPDRASAVKKARRALEEFSVSGVDTTTKFLHHVLGTVGFMDARFNTSYLGEQIQDWTRLSAERGRRQAGKIIMVNPHVWVRFG
jgi:acetyl-CoA carboxylase, biotin carboxylase subunit